jgi:hypothetical protein
MLGIAGLEPQEAMIQPMRVFNRLHNFQQSDGFGRARQANAAPVTTLGLHQFLVGQLINDLGEVRLLNAGEGSHLLNEKRLPGAEARERVHGVAGGL